MCRRPRCPGGGDQREDEVRRLWEDGADDEYLGELKQEASVSFRADVERTLDTEQFERFWTRVVEGRKD